MKNLIKWITTVAVLTVAFVAATPAIKASAQDDYVSYQTFYDDLSPYGEWVYDPQYGDVWVPDVSSDFRPYYTNGYWAMTEYGNMWVSDYPWGWAAFHYGRWTYDPYYGWLWIPGTEWGPAWVSWRSSNSYYGWAPLGPGITLSMSFGNYYCPDNWWIFVGPQYLYRNDFQRYWRGPRYNETCIRSTSFLHNHYQNTYVYGPRPADYQRVTHQRVTVYNVSNGHRPGATQRKGNSVNIFRPQVRATTSNGGRPKPANVYRAPRAINTKPQPVATNTRPEFRTEVQNHQVQLIRGAADNTPRQQLTPAVRPQNTNRQQPVQQQEPRRMERSTPTPSAQPQRTQPSQQQPDRRFDSRPQQVQPQRQQPMQQPQRVEPQRQQPMQQPQRVEPQRQQPQRVEPQRQQPMQQPQRIEPQRQQPQRIEPQRQQPMQQPQRFENRPQPAPQPQRMAPVQQQPQRQQPVIRQEPRQQAAPAPGNNNNGREGRR